MIDLVTQVRTEKADGNQQVVAIGFMFVVGGVLLSHILPGAVPSALVGLASGFGMGPGVSQPLSPPTRLILGVLFSFIFSSSASADGVVCLILHSGPRVIRCSRLVLLAGYSVF